MEPALVDILNKAVGHTSQNSNHELNRDTEILQNVDAFYGTAAFTEFQRADRSVLRLSYQ
jgi:hypothetical protein